MSEKVGDRQTNLALRIDVGLKRRLDAVAVGLDRSTSSAVRRILSAVLDGEFPTDIVPRRASED